MTQAGLPAPASVHMVSSVKQFGVKDLLSELQKSAGMAGDVWVVSPLIEATKPVSDTALVIL